MDWDQGISVFLTDNSALGDVVYITHPAIRISLTCYMKNINIFVSEIIKRFNQEKKQEVAWKINISYIFELW